MKMKKEIDRIYLRVETSPNVASSSLSVVSLSVLSLASSSAARQSKM